MTPTVLDHELYEAWLETHNELPQRLRRLDAVAPRQILGGAERIHDAETGVCLAIVYRNPDLENQQAPPPVIHSTRGAGASGRLLPRVPRST